MRFIIDFNNWGEMFLARLKITAEPGRSRVVSLSGEEDRSKLMIRRAAVPRTNHAASDLPAVDQNLVS
ncbi:hypothetical protein HYQ44_018551 [Verticillium longisporum]|nr:hypothetical protein HYQ44_018551 [Verticillium longisporum]